MMLALQPPNYIGPYWTFILISFCSCALAIVSSSQRASSFSHASVAQPRKHYSFAQLPQLMSLAKYNVSSTNTPHNYRTAFEMLIQMKNDTNPKLMRNKKSTGTTNNTFESSTVSTSKKLLKTVLFNMHRKQQQHNSVNVIEPMKRLIDSDRFSIGLDLQTLSIYLPIYRHYLYKDRLSDAQTRLHNLG